VLNYARDCQLADSAAEDIFTGGNTKAARRVPKDLWRIAARKLSALDYANDLRDLASPGNNLEKLKGALSGKYSIRVNDQYRIVFNFERGEARNVLITDYH
jgi:proteic killer suppression protein